MCQKLFQKKKSGGDMKQPIIALTFSFIWGFVLGAFTAPGLLTVFSNQVTIQPEWDLWPLFTESLYL